jgi:hypothetical protein
MQQYRGEVEAKVELGLNGNPAGHIVRLERPGPGVHLVTVRYLIGKYLTVRYCRGFRDTRRGAGSGSSMCHETRPPPPCFLLLSAW